jgi:hypothetical protein
MGKKFMKMIARTLPEKCGWSRLNGFSHHEKTHSSLPTVPSPNAPRGYFMMGWDMMSQPIFICPQGAVEDGSGVWAACRDEKVRPLPSGVIQMGEKFMKVRVA